MNRYNILPMAVRRFRRPNTSSHELQDLSKSKKAPQVEKLCYFVVFKYLACDGYQNGHDKGIPKTNCTDPKCKPKIESIPGFCPECIAVSMRDDSSATESKRRERKRRQAYNKLSGNSETAPNRGSKLKHDEPTRTPKTQEKGKDAKKTDAKPAPPKRTNTSSTRRSGDSSSLDSGFGGYESSGRVRRPSQSYGGYSYREFVVSQMSPRERSQKSEEGTDRRRSPKPASDELGALFKRV
ncbi:hypothetical protein TWF481_000591 [Arthrobotrys musiformis]|uniref:Uncharacterized protein n=1 Tax=Arthrobotrys musiformis TaxID=47236 RepID=A0AAV9WN15_9PEZI